MSTGKLRLSAEERNQLVAECPTADKALLGELEAAVDRNARCDLQLGPFLAVGKALGEIRERDLYTAAGYSTFEDYCAGRWGWDLDWAEKYIQGYEGRHQEHKDQWWIDPELRDGFDDDDSDEDDADEDEDGYDDEEEEVWA